MVIAIIIGYLAGALLAFFVSKWLLRAIANRLAVRDEQKRSIMVAGAIFGAIALAPAIFMAMMIGGGSLAGHYAGMISEAVGLGEVGVLPALSLGLTLIITITVTAVAAIGAGMGLVLGARGLAQPPPSTSR